VCQDTVCDKTIKDVNCIANLKNTGKFNFKEDTIGELTIQIKKTPNILENKENISSKK
jgi:hypothetical protein